MDSRVILDRLQCERAGAERDLAVGNWPRARRRAGVALELLMDGLKRSEPEISSWLRVFATLAEADRPEAPEAQQSLWPGREDGAAAAGGREAGLPVLRASTAVITQDAGLLRCLQQLEYFAPTDLPVLLEGESGTGKEVVARAVQRMSLRRDGAWVAVNCGAIPVQLQESELFGHARGAYTGATAEKPGLFEAAHKGTLFLDEVGEMDPRAQVKLLRTLETGEVRRLGELRTRQVDVRIVAATNTDVDAAVAERRFREDLLYRLGGVRLKLPALRERPCDVLLLARHFVRKACPRTIDLTPGAQTALLAHPWKGNVRELKFVIERALAVWARSGASTITREMLFPPLGGYTPAAAGRSPVAGPPAGILPSGVSLDAYLEGIERDLIAGALDRSGGNRTLAARALGGLSRTTLIGKMKRLGLFEPL